jgi:hypothetical protein
MHELETTTDVTTIDRVDIELPLDEPGCRAASQRQADHPAARLRLRADPPRSTARPGECSAHADALR